MRRTFVVKIALTYRYVSYLSIRMKQNAYSSQKRNGYSRNLRKSRILGKTGNDAGFLLSQD